MVRELNPIQRTVLTPTQTVTPGTAFAQLGESASQMSSILAQKASSIAVEEQAKKGQLDALEGRAPESLVSPITAGTKAYNDAVVETEGRRMAITAQDQIGQALLEHTNPATFTRETPASFSATLQGIVEGTLENARPETRARLSEHLMQAASHAHLQMLHHSIDFDNRQNKLDFTHELEELGRLRKDALISGDDALASSLKFQQDRVIDNYSAMNEEIKRAVPEIKRKMVQDDQINTALAGYSHATAEGRGGQYLNEFVQNKEKLPFDVWEKAAKEMVQLQATEQRLSHDINAQEFQQAKGAIDNGTLTDVDSLLDVPNLTTTQHLQLMSHLETVQRAQFKSQDKFLSAQNHILRNQSAMVEGKTTNEMLELTQQQFEQSTGRVMTLTDMVESAMGRNGFPISGLPNTPVGRDVPAINAQMKNQLQSTNPTLVREAAENFNRVVNIEKDANAINIDGRALDIATLFNSLNIGAEDPNQLAKEVHDTVMNVKEGEYNSRVDHYQRNIEHVNPRTGTSKIDKKFKEMMGVNPDVFKNNAAMDYFKAEYRLSYLNSNSEEAADKAVAYKMRSWGTSKYFDEGLVAQPVPEKELNITQIGNAFDNQYRIRVQGIINQNEQQRAAGLNIPKIEWVQPKEQSIDVSKLNEEQLVFGRLGQSLQRETLRSYGQFPRPQIKVDGRETEVFLIPGAESKLGDRIQYAMFYKDKFGNMQPIPNPESPTGHAMFSPDGLEEYAPGIFDERFQEQLKEQAIKIQRKQAEQELEQIQGIGDLGKIPFLDIIDTKVKFMRDPDRTKEAFRKLYSTDAADLQQVLRQKIQARHESGAQQLADAASPHHTTPADADHVGIAADSGQQQQLESAIPPVPEVGRESVVAALPSIPQVTNKPQAALVSIIEAIPQLTPKQQKALESIIQSVPDKEDKPVLEDDGAQEKIEVIPKRFHGLIEAAREKPTSKNELVRDVSLMTGTAKDNKELVDRTRAIYPKLSRREAIIVIDNLFTILRGKT